MVGRVWPRHGHRGRPLNLVFRRHEMSIAELHTRYDEKYLLSAMSHHRSQLWWRGPHDRVLWICAAILAGLAAISLAAHAFVPSVVLGGLSGMLPGATLIGSPIDAWCLKKRLRTSPFHNNSLVFRFSATEVHVTGNNE